MLGGSKEKEVNNLAKPPTCQLTMRDFDPATTKYSLARDCWS
jgi:hypothetical protein